MGKARLPSKNNKAKGKIGAIRAFEKRKSSGDGSFGRDWFCGNENGQEDDWAPPCQQELRGAKADWRFWLYCIEKSESWNRGSEWLRKVDTAKNDCGTCWAGWGNDWDWWDDSNRLFCTGTSGNEYEPEGNRFCERHRRVYSDEGWKNYGFADVGAVFIYTGYAVCADWKIIGRWKEETLSVKCPAGCA